MSGSVKKVFTVLITMVASVIIGALVLNTLLPNASKQLINSTEDMIYRASGLSFDINGDGNAGDATSTQYNDGAGTQDNTVNGFK